MLKLRFIWIGKTDVKYLAEGVDDYCDRLRHYANCELLVIKPAPAALGVAKIKVAETKAIIEKLAPGEIHLILDEHGKAHTSASLAALIDTMRQGGTHRINFIVGGAHGLEMSMLTDYPAICLSSLTFTHQMARLILVEQLYRAFTIIHGRGYHHE